VVPTYSASILGTLLSSQGAGAHPNISPIYRTGCRGATRPTVVSRSERVKSLISFTTKQDSLCVSASINLRSAAAESGLGCDPHPVHFSRSATGYSPDSQFLRVKSRHFLSSGQKTTDVSVAGSCYRPPPRLASDAFRIRSIALSGQRGEPYAAVKRGVKSSDFSS
jgi:hypothetical protein